MILSVRGGGVPARASHPVVTVLGVLLLTVRMMGLADVEGLLVAGLGGFLAPLAHTGFGTAIKLTAGSELPPATINLDMDYLSPALPGRWIEVQVQIHKLGRSISVASCSLLDGDTLVARGKGTFINNTRSLHGRAQ